MPKNPHCRFYNFLHYAIGYKTLTISIIRSLKFHVKSQFLHKKFLLAELKASGFN